MANSVVYNEILEILNNIPIEDYLKIPHETIQYFYENIDVNNVQISEPFSKEAYIIFLKIYIKFIASDNKRKQIIEMLNLNSKRMENEKLKNYNYKNIFAINKRREYQQTELIIVEKKWYKVIIEKVKKILKICQK